MTSLLGRCFNALCVCVATVGIAGGCGSDDNSAPILGAIGEHQQVAVGTELRIALTASDPDGNGVTFGYKADIDISDRASLQAGAAGTAVFSWVPIGSDVGLHSLTFSASDGDAKGTRTIEVEVKSAIGGAGSPIFRKPLGTGTTLDLSAKDCVDVPIEIEDSDSLDVQINQEPPMVEGATLDASGLSASWHWCPTDVQKDGGELFPLVLSAYDGDNAKVLKDYLIVLQKKAKPNCPGEAPVVDHTPSDQSTQLDLAIDANVSDEKGLKYAPLLYYSETDPGANPDLGSMTQLTMFELGGGTWSVDIPNPVAGAAPGASATIYYIIVARDNDDEVGDCDHTTLSPPTGAHAMVVTNSGASGGLAPCKTCSSDVQCGADGDNCLYIGSQSFCGAACSEDFECPSTHICSASPIPSVDGQLARQCVPSTGVCGTPVGQCQDDIYEDNDVLADVKTKPALPPGTYSVKSCPGAVFDDEDWYPIDISSQSTVTATLSGGSASNLDLFLKDSTGLVVINSAKPTSQESLTTCLSPGRYYFHVWAWSKAENPYTLTWSKTNGCTAVCTDDVNEDDDSDIEARTADLNGGAFKSTGQKICAWDDDWYAVEMFQGETLRSTLKFTQSTSSQDLDLYVYDQNGSQLTLCTEADPLDCDPSNGQSGTSNENLIWSITSAGTYYVVVHGWEGSQNGYDICIDYTSSSKTSNGCPPL